MAVCDVLLLETGVLLNWVGKVVLQIFFSWIVLTHPFLLCLSMVISVTSNLGAITNSAVVSILAVCAQ